MILKLTGKKKVTIPILNNSLVTRGETINIPKNGIGSRTQQQVIDSLLIQGFEIVKEEEKVVKKGVKNG